MISITYVNVVPSHTTPKYADSTTNPSVFFLSVVSYVPCRPPLSNGPERELYGFKES